jgi:hypothetical protein
MKRIATALMVLAFAAQAQTPEPPAPSAIPFDLEIGFRFLALSGSDAMYRTQINERNGLLLRNFNLATSDFDGGTTLVDRFRIDATDLGTGPAGSLRIEADRAGAYRLRLGYRNTNQFSEIVPGQHSYQRTRSLFDADLELMPDRAIVPFLGFTWNDTHGPGQTTYQLGQDEFRLNQNLKEHDREVRAGASFRLGALQGQLTEGWRNFSGAQTLTLAPGAGPGNNPDPVIGVPVTADTISRTDNNSVKTPFTNFYVTGQFLRRLRLIANYTRFAAESNGGEIESDAGTFVSFPISRFFNGLTEHASSSAKNTTWHGGGRAEVDLDSHVTFVAGYQKEHRQLDGAAIIDTLFLQTLNFAGFDRRDIETILRTSGSITRNEDVANAAVSIRPMGALSVRAEYRESKQDLNVAPDLSEIVIPGSQGGNFDRRVHTADLSATWSRSGLLVGAAYRKDSANRPIFRTDFLDRDRVRVRGSWSSPKNFFRAGLTAERTSQSNDSSMRQTSGDAEIAPAEWLHLRGSLSQFRADSNITFRHPENFTVGESIHSENGKAREGGAAFLRGPFALDASMARFANSGTTPFDIDRYRLRVSYDFAKSKTGVAVEWDRDKYGEPSPSFGDFDATRYGLYFRWHP